ncbi:MAG: lipoyl synthase [Gammaproteobacteria bacterium]|nr:lipoyl synthase [Gammaproteobacteria bacterium]HBF08155.1 lipoyl synthase [Gammaproteobacteria bacterium]
MTENVQPSKKPKPKGIAERGEKLRGADKLARIPIKVIPTEELPRKPDWIRVRLPNNGKANEVRQMLKTQKLNTVCEEASCPNLPECFGKGTATFMIMGDICTRRCPFCDVAHGKPLGLDPDEPKHLAETVAALKLKYVVITSVDRDDLRDGGAQHFADCIKAVREASPDTKIEILVPDFRGRMDVALDILSETPPDVFNHNLENAPRLYKQIRPGSDYIWSLELLQKFKARNPDVPTKSGLMVGLGETDEELLAVFRDMRKYDVDWLTVGQYLQPSRDHHPVMRFVTPETFQMYAKEAREMGFTQVASGPMVRSSYHADLQADGIDVGQMLAKPAK